jgi:hypothetical protein
MPYASRYALEVMLEINGKPVVFIDTPGLAWRYSEDLSPEDRVISPPFHSIPTITAHEDTHPSRDPPPPLRQLPFSASTSVGDLSTGTGSASDLRGLSGVHQLPPSRVPSLPLPSWSSASYDCLPLGSLFLPHLCLRLRHSLTCGLCAYLTCVKPRLEPKPMHRPRSDSSISNSPLVYW